MKQEAQSSPNKQDRSRQQDKNSKETDLRRGRFGKNEKVSMSQLVAAAEMFAEGRTGKHIAEAASHFGNQTMLGLLESGQSLKDGIAAAAGVLSGESPPEFSERAPAADITAQSAFAPVSPPGFSANAPSVGIRAVTGGLLG